MKGALAVLGVVVVCVFLMGGCYVSTYNSLISSSETVDSAWSQVENVYQRRADLIPNLVNVVKGYAAHEKDTFTAVTEARSKVSQINLSAKDLTPERLAQFDAAQGQLSSALSKLMVVVEKYPDLKADKLFLGLQDELAGTENRIAVERKHYNDTARPYNTHVKSFFTNMFFAGKFPPKPYFEAEKGAEKAPKVEF